VLKALLNTDLQHIFFHFIMRHLAAHTILLLLLTALLWQSCATSPRVVVETHKMPDTLRVGTLYSPTSFFLYRGDTLGYDYDRVCDFAKAKKIKLQFKVAPNMHTLIDMIKTKKVDLLVYEIPVTAEFNEEVLHCGETNTTYQVLVQPKSRRRISNVTQLVGKTIYVEKGSKYESRLRNLDSEIGGGINIHTVESDTVNVENLIEGVNNGTIPLTLADNDIAKIDKSYYNNIDIGLDVSFPQRSSWAVNLNDDWLADTIDAWSTSERTMLYTEDIANRYFEQNRTSSSSGSSASAAGGKNYVKHSGDISAYDELFKKYARRCPYDWLLLAAIARTESDFSPNEVSWAWCKGTHANHAKRSTLAGNRPRAAFRPRGQRAMRRERAQLSRQILQQVCEQQSGAHEICTCSLQRWHVAHRRCYQACPEVWQRCAVVVRQCGGSPQVEIDREVLQRPRVPLRVLPQWRDRGLCAQGRRPI
jgi:membrane-bound lytic murein transglycosylase F